MAPQEVLDLAVLGSSLDCTPRYSPNPAASLPNPKCPPPNLQIATNDVDPPNTVNYTSSKAFVLCDNGQGLWVGLMEQFETESSQAGKGETPALLCSVEKRNERVNITLKL